ncbi:MAG TPA: hypothetical protein VLH08_07740 [Acidobacteriota bacterium]|nr:hypothetical protein [Acidobacteriota bacterium]
MLLIFCSSVATAQNYLKYEYKTVGRECGSPGYKYNWQIIEETAQKYPNPTILIVTPEEKTEVQEELKAWNEQGKPPEKFMDPCSSCSQYYEVCIVFYYLDENVSNCSNWEEWRNDWDKKVHELITTSLSKAFADPNSYTINYNLAVGPDGKVRQVTPAQYRWNLPAQNSRVPPFSRQELQDLTKQGPQTLAELNKAMSEGFSKMRACPFPKDTRLKVVSRTPSLYHNVPGKDKYTPSSIPKEP